MVNDSEKHLNQLQKIIELFRKGKFEETYDKCIKLIDEKVETPFVYNLLGMAEIKLNHFNDSINSFKKAIKLNKNFVEAYNNMASSLINLGRFKEAIDILYQAIKIRPDYPNAYNNIASAYNDLGNYEEALKNYEDAYRKDPTIIRRIETSIPVVFSNDGTDFSRIAEGYLKNSPQTAFNMMQQLASYARNANEKLSIDAFESNEKIVVDESEIRNKQLTEDEKNEFKKKKKLQALLDEFDSDIEQINNKQVPDPVKYTVYAFGFLIFFLIFWGSISEVDTSVSANGKITTIVPNVEVQSNYKSVVKEVLVKKGQSVNEGDPLVIFDSTLQKADKRKLNYQLNVLNSKIDRLRKQALLRTDKEVSNPLDDRQSKIFRDKK